MISSFGVEAAEDDRHSVQPAANKKAAARAEDPEAAAALPEAAAEVAEDE